MKRIYLDYASLTPIDKGVMKEIRKYSKDEYTNPSSIYSSGVKAFNAIKDARTRISNVLHAHPDEILFTSGGTESNQLVLNMFKGKRVLVSAIEHSSIIKHTDAMHIPVDSRGIVDLDAFKKMLTNDIALVSVMLVNNEIGSVQPIAEICKIVRDFNKKNNTNIVLHTDACQAITHIPLYVEKLGIDLMTLDGHKMYGPRGMGMLYVKRGLKIDRPGTENTPGIMGLALAVEKSEILRDKETKRILELKKYIIAEIQKINPNILVNGDTENAVPHILNVNIPNIDNEFFILQLDAKGIECSSKSACLRDEDESYVLKSIGVNSKNSIRFSFGRKTSKGDIRKTVKVIAKILEK
jgi:cysteine desulfurase